MYSLKQIGMHYECDELIPLSKIVESVKVLRVSNLKSQLKEMKPQDSHYAVFKVKLTVAKSYFDIFEYYAKPK